jgi:hypothetical protein
LAVASPNCFAFSPVLAGDFAVSAVECGPVGSAQSPRRVRERSGTGRFEGVGGLPVSAFEQVRAAGGVHNEVGCSTGGGGGQGRAERTLPVRVGAGVQALPRSPWSLTRGPSR